MRNEKYRLKNSVSVCGEKYEIRSDYGVILDIIEALNDRELDDRGKTYVALAIFYPEFESMPKEHYKEALEECFRFINGGQNDDGQKHPKLVDWEQDFPLIVGAVNRVLGYDIRSVQYDEESNTGGVSWETFLAAYQEIGDCTFAQVVSIRDKQARHKPLDKSEKEWLRRNRNLVEFKRKYTEAEESLLKEWT